MSTDEFDRRLGYTNITSHERFDPTADPCWKLRFEHGRADSQDYNFQQPEPVIRRLRRITSDCHVEYHSGDRITADFRVFDGMDCQKSSALFGYGDEGSVLREFRTHLPPQVVPDFDIGAERADRTDLEVYRNEDSPERAAVVAVADVVAAAGPPSGQVVVYVDPASGVPHVTLGSPKGHKLRPNRPEKHRQRTRWIGDVPPGAFLDFLAGLQDAVDRHPLPSSGGS